MIKKRRILNKNSLIKIIGSYLEAAEIEEEPEKWFFDGDDTLTKIRRVSGYILEYHPNLKRSFVQRVLVYYYSLGKERYDRRRIPLVRR